MILESGAELSAARNSYSNYNLQQLNYSYNYSWYCYWGRCWRIPYHWIHEAPGPDAPTINRELVLTAPSTARSSSSYVLVEADSIANLDDVEADSLSAASTAASSSDKPAPRRRWGKWKKDKSDDF